MYRAVARGLHRPLAAPYGRPTGKREVAPYRLSGSPRPLRLPDGTTIGAIQDGQSQSIELIPPRATVKDLYTRFEIDDPASGSYALLVRSFDNAEDEIPFTIP